jgi:hypothetical protein
MPQKDYILRQIEILGAALIALRKKIMGGGVTGGEVEARLQEVSQQGGMALDLARAASPETLKMLIAPTGEIEPGSCWLLAETLYLDGIHAGMTGQKARALDSLGKARVLFSLLKPMGAFLAGFPEAAERIREIDEMVEDSDEPSYGDSEESPRPSS